MRGLTDRATRWGGVLACALLVAGGTAALSAPVGATGTDIATTYQGGPLHDGSQADDLAPPLTEAWSHPFGQPMSYPVIADQMAFLTVEDDAPPIFGTMVEAVSLSTGSVVWSVPGPVDSPWSTLAYGDGQLFALGFSGDLMALDPLTGTVRWDTMWLPNATYTSAPVFSNGDVYVVGSAYGDGGVLAAVDDRYGSVMWQAPVAVGAAGSPVVTDAGVYVSSACQQAAYIDPTTAAPIWADAAPCQGAGSGTTPVLHDGRLYVRDPLLGGVVLDATTGAKVGVFAAGPAPAFAGSTGFFVDGGTLTAVDVTTQATLWRFTGDGSLDTAPLVANGVVYEGSGTGAVYAVSAATGSLEWEGSAGAGIAGPDEQSTTQPLTGMAVGEGTLVVPAGDTLVAYRSQVVPPATPPSVPQHLVPVVGLDRVDVVWAPPAADGGDPVTGYDVYRTGPGGAAALVASVGGAATDYVDDTVRPETTYTYTVTATNAAGTSPASAPASVLAAGAPGAPTAVTATPGNGQVTLQWQGPASDGGSPIIGYDVYEGTSPGGESATPVDRIRAIGNFDTRPEPNGTTVYFTVRTVTDVGDSPPSAEVSATPSAAAPAVGAVFPRTGSGTGYTLVWVEGGNFTGVRKVTVCESGPFKVFSSTLLLVLAPPCPWEPIGFDPQLLVNVQVTTAVGASDVVPGDEFTYTWSGFGL